MHNRPREAVRYTKFTCLTFFFLEDCNSDVSASIVSPNLWDPYPRGGVVDTVEESLSVIWCKGNINEIEKIPVDINYKLVDLIVMNALTVAIPTYQT